MFSYQHNDTFSFFILDNSGIKIPMPQWAELQDNYLSQLSILNEFVDNGLGIETTDACEVDTLPILKLSDIDRQILGLPYNYPYEIYIQAVGTLNQSSFNFRYGFYDFVPNGNLL